MTFSRPGLTYSIQFTKQAKAPSGADFRSFQIEERDGGKLIRTFTGRVPASQSVRPGVIRAIERWCELFPARLPRNGGTLEINIDSVRRE